MAPFNADNLSSTVPTGVSVMNNVETSEGHEFSDPIMDAALETFKAVNRKQLGAFMQSFTKFIPFLFPYFASPFLVPFLFQVILIVEMDLSTK